MINGEHKQIIEALVFASDFPLPVKKISQIIEDLGDGEVQEILEELQREYDERERGFVLQKTAGGYEFVSRPEYHAWVGRLYAGRRKNRLSRAALETVAIVAYNQPITGVEIEKIRGVDCSGPLKTLLERNLIVIAGREKAPGRPIVYKITDDFLRYFGIDSVKDLPRLEEIEDIMHHGGEIDNISIEQLSVESGNSGEEEVRSPDPGGTGDGERDDSP